MLKICLQEANYFAFAGKYYGQMKGMFMGSSLAPILVERVIEDIVDKALNDLKLEPDFWGTLVDEHLTSIPKETAEILKEKLNSYHPMVQFTIELQRDDNTIDFLDTTIQKCGGKLKTKWFHKPIASNRILNYYSKHPKHMVLNTAKNFIRKIFTLSHASYYEDNIQTIKRILGKNNFSTKMISEMIQQVKSRAMQKSNGSNLSYPFLTQTITIDDQPKESNQSEQSANQVVSNQTSKPKFAGLTYVPGLSEILKKQITKFAPNVTIASRPPEKVGKLFTDMKQKLRTGQCPGVVYDIPC